MKMKMKLYWLTLIVFGAANTLVQADDTEIYLGNPNTQTAKPNIVFIFDTSGSMATEVSTGETRLELTQAAAIDTISGLSGVNLALMRFNGRAGGYFSLPMKSIDDPTHKSAVITAIQNYSANGATPLVESVSEAYLYYTGGYVVYGKGLNHAETFSGNNENTKYISPIIKPCQTNHIVLFTDGASTYDSGSDTGIRKLLADSFSENDLAGTALSTITGFQCSSNPSGIEGNSAETSCLKDLAYVMNKVDAASWIDGKQTVQFHAIGGFIGGDSQGTLDSAAALGGGVSRNAQNYSELKGALQALFYNIVQSSGTFAAPAVSVNAFNSLEQLDQMYYSVFKPHETVGWAGNVKRFRMAGDKIVDVNGNNAIDPDTGFFFETAQSYWTPDRLAPDGDNVIKGGMASRLQDDRKVGSNIVSKVLMSANNRIRSSNTKITRDLMGTNLTDAADPFDANEFTKLVQWVGGLDSKFDSDTSRKSMEDPLHSTPVLLNYGELTIAGKKVPDSTLFIGTNSGYLHAFDTHQNAPKERFAFIPKELLPVATKYYKNDGKKQYGLDGHISVWHDDTNKDMLINNNEKAYLYVGMRRGGSSYYALNVSNRDYPKLLWQINGKNHQNGPTNGFEELGHTWSKMLPIDVKWKGVKTKVLLFGGGYDIAEDNLLTRTAHSVGNAIFMVNAKTGKLLWKASPNSGANLKLNDMKSAITGNIVAVDNNSNGFVDLLYIADLGGRIFRIDFDSSATTANAYATGGMIADLGKDSSQREHVRFYETLDVVYSKAFGYVEGSGSDAKILNGKPRYMLSIGSGYRAHPLDSSTQDNFYVLFDYNTDGPERDANGQPTYVSVKKSDLESYMFSARDLDITPTQKSNNGFYIKLIDASSGEKVLSSSLTLNNTIYFTSFRPSDSPLTASCSNDTGQSRLYQLNLMPGINSQISVQDIAVSGIPPKPVLILPKADADTNGGTHRTPKLLISTQVFDTIKPKSPLKKTYWRELER